MAKLVILRHAQASFLADNYDQLSALGRTQARILGESWAASNLRFDRVACGPRERQKDTAEAVRAACTAAGQTFPAIEIFPEFDEYAAEAVMNAALPILCARDPQVHQLEQAYTQANAPTNAQPHDQAQHSRQRRLAFQRLFENVMAQWVAGTVSLPGVESWAQFQARVNRGLDRFLARPEFQPGQQGQKDRNSEPGQPDQQNQPDRQNAPPANRVAIFTSAGPTAIAVQRALALSDQKTLELSWMPRNASWSEFLYTSTRFTLSTFNAFGHFSDPTHLTFR